MGWRAAGQGTLEAWLCPMAVQGHCLGQRVEACGSSHSTASLEGWPLLSGGGSINPWERLDQWKSGNSAAHVQIWSLMLPAAEFGTGLLCL